MRNENQINFTCFDLPSQTTVFNLSFKVTAIFSNIDAKMFKIQQKCFKSALNEGRTTGGQ